MNRRAASSGFTLIELSIVLVIIGFIVGGVLVGQSLIKAAEVRATITQIEKYNTAANTFRGKYGYLPGDIRDPDASNFGFAERGTGPGQGDGNGLLEGYDGVNYGEIQACGETAMFWADLSKAQLVDGSFTAASSWNVPSSDITLTTTPNVGGYLPQAKVGSGFYIYVYSNGHEVGPNWVTYNVNYFGLSQVTTIQGSYSSKLVSGAGLSVQDAYAIDKKIDDGFPQSGNVIATYLNGDTYWADGTAFSNNPSTAATAGSSTTCYDNANTAGNPQQYSVKQSGGAGVNCALSFKMQAGD